MDNSTQTDYDGADKCRGTASLFAANLMSDAFFQKGVTPGGYSRAELGSVVYVEIGLLAPPSSGGEPDDAVFARWEEKLTDLAGSLAGITARRTAVSYYLVLIVDAKCREGEGAVKLREILTRVQKKMERIGMISETVDVDPESGTYEVISDRKIRDRRVRTTLEKTLAASAAMSGEEQAEAARERINTAREKVRSLEASRESRMKGPNLLIFLIIANVLIFVTGFIFELATGSDPLVAWGIQDNAKIFAGEWWRLITSMFLHADWMHLFSNMIFLFMLGRSLDRYYGNFQLWLIYFAGGLAGNLLGLAFSDSLSLGASGAIMGLGGALLYRMTLGKNAREFRHTGNFTWLAFSVGFNLVYGLFNPGIDNYGHFGGFGGGFIVALIIGLVQNSKTKKKNKENT